MGAPSRTRAGAACATASGATALSADAPLGSPTSVSSASWTSTRWKAPVSRSRAKTRIGMRGGSGPSRPATADRPSAVSVPRSWPGRGELVGRRLGRADRVVDDRVDVGVLQRSSDRRPAASSGWPKRPHAVAVDVGDRADRAAVTSPLARPTAIDAPGTMGAPRRAPGARKARQDQRAGTLGAPRHRRGHAARTARRCSGGERSARRAGASGACGRPAAGPPAGPGSPRSAWPGRGRRRTGPRPPRWRR